MSFLKRLFRPIWKIVERYPVIISGIVIYFYYLLASVNYFVHAKEKTTFLDYMLQFDSLLWMWLAAAAWLQVQRYRQRQMEETAQKKMYEFEIQLQQVQNDLLNDITHVLQDSINNPLAIISLKTQEIRRKFEADAELMQLLETIERAMKRIEQTIRDLKGYEAQKMMKATAERFGKMQSSQTHLVPKERTE